MFAGRNIEKVNWVNHLEEMVRYFSSVAVTESGKILPAVPIKVQFQRTKAVVNPRT